MTDSFQVTYSHCQPTHKCLGLRSVYPVFPTLNRYTSSVRGFISVRIPRPHFLLFVFEMGGTKMKTALITLILTASIVSLPKAEACSPPPQHWQFSHHRAVLGLESGDALIIFRGRHAPWQSEDSVLDQVEVAVSHGDTIIDGTLETTVVSDTLVWRALEPVDPSIEYSITLKTKMPWSDDFEEETMAAQWPIEPRQSEDISIYELKAVAVDHEVEGDCVEGGWENSCGGCEREVLRTEAHWTAQVELNADQDDSHYIMGRIEVGVDEESALEALAQARFRTLRVNHGRTSLGRSAGQQSEWPGDKACVAIEIVTPDGSTVFKEVECLKVPRTEVKQSPRQRANTTTQPKVGVTAVTDNKNKGEPEDKTNVPLSEQDDSNAVVSNGSERNQYGSGGCSMTSTGSGHAGAFIFALMIVLGHRRLRACA